MRTVRKFKIQPTVALFAAVNHCSRPLRKQQRLGERVRKIVFLRCDWRSLNSLSVSVDFRTTGCHRNYD